MKELFKSLVADIDKKLQEEYEQEFAQYKPPTNVISLKNYKLKQFIHPIRLLSQEPLMSIIAETAITPALPSTFTGFLCFS